MTTFEELMKPIESFHCEWCDVSVEVDEGFKGHDCEGSTLHRKAVIERCRAARLAGTSWPGMNVHSRDYEVAQITKHADELEEQARSITKGKA